MKGDRIFFGKNSSFLTLIGIELEERLTDLQDSSRGRFIKKQNFK